MNYTRVSDLIHRLDQAEKVRNIMNEQVKGLICDLVKEHEVITNDLIWKVAQYSRVEAVKLYRDQKGCDLREAMLAVEKMMNE